MASNNDTNRKAAPSVMEETSKVKLAAAVHSVYFCGTDADMSVPSADSFRETPGSYARH